MAKYRVLIGINYPPNRRAEIGDVVDDLPAKSIKWLRESGAVALLDKDGNPVDEVPAEVPAEEPAPDTTPEEPAPAEGALEGEV